MLIIKINSNLHNIQLIFNKQEMQQQKDIIF